jgi:UDP:flavonoid glycosyltransferase YjiC (YdhE family)
MRTFFSFVGGRGHFDPLIPIARAAEAEGHDVAVSSGPRMVPEVLAAGFVSFATAPGRIGGGPSRQPLQAVDRGRELNDVREGFIRQAAPKRAEVLKEQFAAWALT